MSLVSDFMTSLVGGALLKANGVSKINHSGVKGTLREIFLSNLIMPFFPAQFSAGSGTIVNSLGAQSKETDIIIYDNRIMKPWISESKGIFPIESVIATVEVKSALESRDILEAQENATHLLSEVWYKSMWEGNRDAFVPPLAYLFAFSGSGFAEMNDARIGKALLKESVHNLKGICIAGKYSWMNLQETGWTDKSDGVDSHEEIKRFIAILIDNVRTVSQIKWSYYGMQHFDWVGQYIRTKPAVDTQPGNPSPHPRNGA